MLGLSSCPPFSLSSIDFALHHDFSNKALASSALNQDENTADSSLKSIFTINFSAFLDVLKSELADAMKKSSSSLQSCKELCAIINEVLKKQDKSKTTHPNFFETHAYFSLLELIFDYNILISRIKIGGKYSNELSNLIDKIRAFESDEHPYHIKDSRIKQLYDRFLQQLMPLHQFVIRQEKTSARYVLPEAMKFHVVRKNELAGRFESSSYQGEVVNPVKSTLFFGADPNAAKELVAKMKTILDNQIESRTQILAYIAANGHADHMDVHYNAQQKHLEIISIGSFPNTMQYHFLRLMKEELNHQALPHRLYACQSELQRTGTG